MRVVHQFVSILPTKVHLEQFHQTVPLDRIDTISDIDMTLYEDDHEFDLIRTEDHVLTQP